MSRMFAILAVVLLCVTSVASAADIYGFGSMTIPTEPHEQYTWERLRFGVDAPLTVSHFGAFDAHLLLETSQSKADVKFGYVSKKLGDATLNVGKYLAPTQHCFDGSKGIQLSAWPYPNQHFTCFGQGARLDGKSGYFSASVAHMNDGHDSRLAGIFTTTVVDTVGPAYDRTAAISFYGEGHIGYGMYARMTINRWLNPSFGGSAYSESVARNISDGEQYFFVQQFVQLHKSVRLYGQYDMTNRDNLPDRGIVGLTWEYAKCSYVRAYYDTEAGWMPSVSFAYSINVL